MLLQIEMVSVHWGLAAGAPALLVTDSAHVAVATLQRIRAPPDAAARGLSFYGRVLALNGRQHLGVLRLETSQVPQIALRALGAQGALCAYPFALNELLFRRGVVLASDAGLPPGTVALLCSHVLNHSNTAVRLVNIGAAVRELARAHLAALAGARGTPCAPPPASSDPWDAALRALAQQHARQLQASYTAGCSR